MANATQIGISSIAPSSQGISADSSSPSSLNKYDPVRIGPEDCIRRIKQIANVISAQIPPKNNGNQFNCGVMLEAMKEPTLLGPCGHIFDRSSTVGIATALVTTCPTCRVVIQSRTPDLLVKDLINDWQQEDRILTLSHFKKEKEKLADKWIQTAKHFEAEKEYDEALAAYTQAFLYTKKAEAYAAIPQLYLKLEQTEKTALAYLHLAMYQLQEGKAREAIETLKSAEQNSPNPLKIDVLLMILALEVDSSQEQMNKAILNASVQKDPEDAIAIYKHVIAVNPRQLDAYIALCPLLQDSAERNHLLLTAADLAKQNGDVGLALQLRADANIPIYPTAISKEDWMNPAAFLAKLPPKPQALQDYLAAPCPIFGGAEGKTRAETHIVIARPKNIIISGALVPFTLSALNKLDKESRGTGFQYITDDILKLENNLDTPPEIELEWLVMTKEVLPRSLNKNYAFQKSLAEAAGYQVPGFRDAATCTLLGNRDTESPFYADNQFTHIRCHEMLQGYHLVIGGHAPDNLRVQISFNEGEDEEIGIAGLRKF